MNRHIPPSGLASASPMTSSGRRYPLSRVMTGDGGNVIDLTLNAPMRTGQWI